jgi:hypothetical protein
VYGCAQRIHLAAACRGGLTLAGAPLIKPRKLFKQAEPALCYPALTHVGEDFSFEIPAVAFAKLTELAKAKLVVLATCDSLILAAKLAKITNMIAATDFVFIKDILQWELGLYKCLSKGISLSNSFETACSLSNAPMLLLLKKDVAFIG